MNNGDHDDLHDSTLDDNVPIGSDNGVAFGNRNTNW